MIEELNIDTTQRTKCEIWTRVMGYHRPVTEFNMGKKSEYAERNTFIESKAMAACAAETAVA
ncbi:MAG: anaerobic ribonucleoside-triphosphate reductase [Fibrobacterales bacterium]